MSVNEPLASDQSRARLTENVPLNLRDPAIQHHCPRSAVDQIENGSSRKHLQPEETTTKVARELDLMTHVPFDEDEEVWLLAHT
jgi:hypothetical protein